MGIEFESQELIIPIQGATLRDSLLIRKITGLDAPDAKLFVGNYSRDGGTYQGRRVGQRNVVITMDLNPNPALDETVSGLRKVLYKLFMNPAAESDHVRLNFYDDSGTIYYTIAYAENVEAGIFDVETLTQISLICPDPYLWDSKEVVVTQEPGWVEKLFVYEGTAKAGFQTTIYIDSPTSTLTIDNNGQTMVLSRSLDAGDVINLSTVEGDRRMTLTRGGVTTSVVAGLSILSPWMKLHSQDNLMKIYGDTEASKPASMRELRYRPAYWGV